jgi:PST family polysaccharide transporter
MTFQEKIAKGIVWSATRLWGKQLITFLVFVVLSRLLEPEAFGLVALASVFTAFMTIFVDQGFGQAIVQKAEIEQKHLDTAFWTGILIGGLLTIVTIAASTFIADLFNEIRLVPIIRWLSLNFIFAAFSSIQKTILRRNLAFKSLAIRSMFEAVIAGMVGVTMAYMGFGVWSLVAMTLVGSLVGAIVLWRVCDWRPGLNISGKHFRELSTFGLNIVGIKILDFFNRRSYDLLIGYFLGPVILGYYTIAYKLLLVMIQLLTGIITSVAFPAFSRLQYDIKRMQVAFYRATQYTSLIAFPAFLGMSIIAPELIIALFGEKWASSVPIMQVLAFVGLLHSVSLFNASVIKAAGKPSWQLGIMLITSICITLVFFLVVEQGIVAIATAYVVCSYMLSPISIWAVKRLIQINLRTLFMQFIAPLTGSLVMIGIIMGTKFILNNQVDLYWQLSIYICVGALTYISFILLTARETSREMLGLIHLALPKVKLKKV